MLFATIFHDGGSKASPSPESIEAPMTRPSPHPVFFTASLSTPQFPSPPPPLASIFPS
jgi:hypothetical protein